MKELTLSWTNQSYPESHTLRPHQPSKTPGKIRIGRDPAQCDLVIPSITEEDLTVSKLHIEIYFDETRHQFYLRNLKGTANPPTLYGTTVGDRPVPLDKDGSLYLGRKKIRLTLKETAEPPKSPEIAESPLVCPHCRTGYSYAEAAKMNHRCYKDGFPLQGGSIYISDR